MKAKHFPIVLLIHLLSFQNVIAQTVYYDNDIKLYGIIDRTGKSILKPTFEEMTMFESGLSRFKKDNKWGLINEKGLIILKPEFETEYGFCKRGFNDGLISVEKGGKYGYYSEKGDLVIEHKFDWTEQFCEGIAWVKVSEKYSFINLKGKYITDKWFDDVKIIDGVTYGEDETPVYDKDGNYAQGLATRFYKIDKNGMVALAENQKYISDYKTYYVPYCDKFKKNPPNISAIRDEKKRAWGYKNNKNELIGDASYYYASNFNDGVALVIFKDKSKNSAEGMAIINEKIEIIKVLDKKFQDGWGFANGLMQLKYLVSKPDDEIQKWEYVLVNSKGEIIKKMNRGVFPVPSGG